MRRILLPLVALLVAGASTFAVRGWLERGNPPEQAARRASEGAEGGAGGRGRAARRLFRPGRRPALAGVARRGRSRQLSLRGRNNEADLVGAVVRRPIAAGQPISADSVVKPGDRGFLAAVLDPGMRAISVPIDEAAGNAGLIFPGDHVDLILTQSIEAAGDPAGSRRVSETVLEDLRVIAIGRRLKDEGGEEAAGGKQPRTATLEATPEAAEKIALVNELGKLALSLRSLAVAGARQARHDSGHAHLGHRCQPGAAAGEPAPIDLGRDPWRQGRDRQHPSGSRVMSAAVWMGRRPLGCGSCLRLRSLGLVLALAPYRRLGRSGRCRQRASSCSRSARAS